VHVPAREFLDKYRCLAAKDPEPLPSDEKRAAAKILRSLKLPETEWQIGKSKVFLRNSVFDPLEEKRRKLLTEKMNHQSKKSGEGTMQGKSTDSYARPRL